MKTFRTMLMALLICTLSCNSGQNNGSGGHADSTNRTPDNTNNSTDSTILSDTGRVRTLDDPAHRHDSIR